MAIHLFLRNVPLFLNVQPLPGVKRCSDIGQAWLKCWLRLEGGVDTGDAVQVWSRTETDIDSYRRPIMPIAKWYHEIRTETKQNV